jgi:hypothetical protein
VDWGLGRIICALFSFSFSFLAIAVFFWLNLASWVFFQNVFFFPLVITIRFFIFIFGGGGGINPNFSIQF